MTDIAAEDVASTAEEILSLADDRESTSTDDGQAAPDSEEAQAASEQPDSEEAVSDEGLAEENQEEQKPAGRSQKLQKLIESKGGDEEKFAESVYQQMNSAASLAKKVRELEEKLTEVESLYEKPSAPEPDLKHPDLDVLQQDIQALDAEAANNNAEQRNILVEIGKTERAIAVLEGRMLSADDYEKSVLKTEQYQLNQALRGLEKAYKDIEWRNPRLLRERREIASRLEARKQQLEAEKAQQRSRASEEKAYKAAFRTRFENTVSSVAKKYGVPEASLEFVMDTAKAKASVFLRNLPAGSPGLDADEDMTTFIGSVVAKYAEDRGIVNKAKFTNYSKNKLAAVSNAPRAAAPKQQSSMPEPPKTNKDANSAAFWRQRAAKILG
jgi:hypothetical protein